MAATGGQEPILESCSESPVRRTTGDYRAGEPAVVVLSARDYDALRAHRPTLVDDLLSGLAWDGAFSEAVMERSSTPSREVAF